MLVYRTKNFEFMREGFTHLFRILTADLAVGFSNKQLVLTGLVKGDVVQGAVADFVTAVTGPTGNPTAQVKANTAGAAMTVAGDTTTLPGVVGNNTVAGAVIITTATDNLVLDLQVGGGNGAAATAGEIWVWAKISRAVDRLSVQT